MIIDKKKKKEDRLRQEVVNEMIDQRKMLKGNYDLLYSRIACVLVCLKKLGVDELLYICMYMYKKKKNYKVGVSEEKNETSIGKKKNMYASEDKTQEHSSCLLRSCPRNDSLSMLPNEKRNQFFSPFPLFFFLFSLTLLDFKKGMRMPVHHCFHFTQINKKNKGDAFRNPNPCLCSVGCWHCCFFFFFLFVCL